MALAVMRKRALALIAAATAAYLAAVGSAVAIGGNAGNKPPGPSVDLAMAIRQNDRCPRLADSLPTLVAVSGMQPGELTSPVVVCAANEGRQNARLYVGIIERSEWEGACTGDEPQVDVTCGSGQGELGTNLNVLIATQPLCQGAFSAPRRVAFADLEAAPEVLPGLGLVGRRDCISLALEYLPLSPEAAAAGQSDAVRWRYRFVLST